MGKSVHFVCSHIPLTDSRSPPVGIQAGMGFEQDIAIADQAIRGRVGNPFVGIRIIPELQSIILPVRPEAGERPIFLGAGRSPVGFREFVEIVLIDKIFFFFRLEDINGYTGQISDRRSEASPGHVPSSNRPCVRQAAVTIHPVHFEGRANGGEFRLYTPDFRPDLRVQEVGHGDRRQDADNRYHDQQFDQGK